MDNKYLCPVKIQITHNKSISLLSVVVWDTVHKFGTKRFITKYVVLIKFIHKFMFHLSLKFYF